MKHSQNVAGRKPTRSRHPVLRCTIDALELERKPQSPQRKQMSALRQ
jgi:hypothetical protein